MAAPKGNQFWKLRSKHGRDELFATPELLREAAYEYFQWCDDNPWVMRKLKTKSGANGGGTEDEEVPAQRPYTLSGLCLYIGASERYWWEFKKAGREDFSDIIMRIEEIIETQQFEGATVGAFNSNIIARKLGLSDKREVKTEEKKANPYDALSDEQLRKIQQIIKGDD